MKEENKQKDPVIDWVFVFIIFSAFVLRLMDLTWPSHILQPDEMFSMKAALQPTIGDLIKFVAVDTHPPLYFLVLRGWFKLVPVTFENAKMLSILFNVLNIALTFRLALLWGNRKTALLAALVMALSPWNIYWSHLARNHQMLPPLFTASTLALFLWFKKDKKGFPAWYAILSILMIQTNYLSFFILFTHGVIILWKCRKDFREALYPFLAIIISVMSYLPFLFTFTEHLTKGPMRVPFGQHVVSPGLLFYHFLFFNLFTGNLGDLWYPPPHSWYMITTGGLVLSLLIIFAAKKIKDPVFWMLLVIPPVITLITARILGTTMAERYLAYCIGPFAIMIAAGIRGVLNFHQKQIKKT